MSDQAEWDRRFMQKAMLLASFSKDPSTKVGAAIATSDNRGVSEGYNGFPRGVRDFRDRLDHRETRLAMTIHAEMNAIIFARRDLTACTLYCTFIPCSSCAAVIVQVGIVRVVAFEPTPDLLKRWGTSIAVTKTMFAEAGVKLDIMQHIPLI